MNYWEQCLAVWQALNNFRYYHYLQQSSDSFVDYEGAGQEATVRTGHGITDGSKLGKEYVKPVYCHPAYLTYMQSTS